MALAAPPTSTRPWVFDGLTGALGLPENDPLAASLQACLDGWGARSAPAVPAPEWIAHATALGSGRWRVTSRYTDRPTGALSAAGAVCALVADLALARIAEHPELLGLHAAAVELDGLSLVLTGPARAGKTTFAARLALEPGARFLCDDVLAITPDNSALAMGIAPRLRLPVPQGALPETLMAQAAVLSDTRYAYLRLPGALRYGATSPLGAILSYERRSDLAPGLYHLSVEEALPLLMRQSLGRFDTAEGALDRLLDLVSNLPRARLICGDLTEGLALVQQWRAAEFAGDLPAAPRALTRDLPQNSSPPAKRDQDYVRALDVELRQTGAIAWLWREDGMIWELNPTAHALWQLLEIPGSAAVLAEVMAEVYPAAQRTQIEADLCHCLAQLAAEGFVVAV